MKLVTDPELIAQFNGTAQPKPAAPDPNKAPPSFSLRSIFNSPTYRAATHGFSNAATLGAYDKYLSPRPLTEDERKQAPVANSLGEIAGGAAISIPFSAGVGGLLPALRGAGTAANIGNQALTSGAMAAGEQAIAGEKPSIGNVLFSMLTGGAMGGASSGLGKFLSPNIRISGATSNIDDATKQGMKDVIDLGKRHGVDVSLPQAAETVAPGEVSALDTLYNTSKPSAQDIHNDFVVGQKNAAPKALQSAKNEVQTNVAPLYKQTENILFPGLPTAGSTTHSPTSKQAFAEVVSKLQKDPVTGVHLGGRAAHSGLVADAARKELDDVGKSMADRHPFKASLYRNTADDVYSALKQNPHYLAADNAYKDGMSGVDSLKRAVETNTAKTGGESGAHGLIGAAVQHPFVLGGALAGLGGGVGAMEGGREGGVGGAGLGLAATMALTAKNNSVRRKVVKKLLDSGNVDKLGKRAVEQDMFNALGQGLLGWSRP